MSTPTAVIIPLDNSVPWFSFKIILSGTLYTLRFMYNVRANRWYMDIGNAQDNDLLTTIPLLVGRNLVGSNVVPGLPPGLFFVTDDTNSGTEATRYSFGLDHTLWYYDPTGTT